MIAKRTTEVDNIFYKCFLDFAPVQTFFLFPLLMKRKPGNEGCVKIPSISWVFPETEDLNPCMRG
jgi:hypothetical protein